MSGSIVHDVEKVASLAPAAPAISWHGSRWTYADLVKAIGCVRRSLAERRLAPGSRVALLMRNSPQYAAAYYGIMASGHVAVPLNVQEHAQVLSRQIDHAECGVAIADARHQEAEALRAALKSREIAWISISMHDGEDSCAKFCESLGAQDTTPIPPRAASDLATIIYTSGTTGRPKGVMLSHGNLHANARAIAGYLSIVPADRVLCVLPFHFSYGCSVLNSNLLAGAHILLEDSFAFPHVVLRRMQDAGVTGFAGVPSTFALMLGRCKLPEFDLSRLRYVTQAGGAMPRPQIEQLRSAMPNVKVFIMYGQTEATARLSYLPPEMLDAKPGSVGLPLQGLEIEVRGDDDRVLGPNEVGEVCARGASIMQGYWRDPELSAQALRKGWLRTGDLGHKDRDGYLFIDGRAVEMIKVGAFRVAPQEVEEVLAAFPGVEEVAVTSVPDDVLGQAVKAVIVLRGQAPTDVRSIKLHCRQHLAAYKVPKVVEFASSLPRTSSGKVQRYKLA